MIPLRYKTYVQALYYDLFASVFDPLRRKIGGTWPRHNGDSLFIHIPKSAGISLFEALGERNAGHRLFCDVPAHEKAVCKRIVFCTRDPLERLQSSYRYLRRIAEDRNLVRRLGVVSVPETFHEFLTSEHLPHLAAHHYFFRSQFRYLQGVEEFTPKLVHLRFDSLAIDASRELGLNLRKLNAAPTPLLQDNDPASAKLARERVRSIYRDDYEALPALLASCGARVAWVA